MKRKRRKPYRSYFLAAVLGYAALAAAVGWLLRDHLNEARASLILFGILPVVMALWMADAIRQGEITRLGPRSVTESLTMNARRITRRDQPVQFWLAILATGLLALSILAFALLGLALTTP